MIIVDDDKEENLEAMIFSIGIKISQVIDLLEDDHIVRAAYNLGFIENMIQNALAKKGINNEKNDAVDDDVHYNKSSTCCR